MQASKVVYRKKAKLLPWLPIVHDQRANWSRRRYARNLQRGLFDNGEWPVIECESLGPGLPGNSTLARFWDNVALTKEEGLSLKALRLMDDSIERVAVVGEDRRLGRRVVVKLRDHPRPVPLKSLGDGVTRLFAAGLALVNSRDGFLVVDEAENGIHYSVQRDFWRMVLRAAHLHNVHAGDDPQPGLRERLCARGHGTGRRRGRPRAARTGRRRGAVGRVHGGGISKRPQSRTSKSDSRMAGELLSSRVLLWKASTTSTSFGTSADTGRTCRNSTSATRKGFPKLARAIGPELKVSGRRAVGILADANDDLNARWQAIAGRLRQAGIDPPTDMTPAGIVIEGRPRIGSG